MKRSLPACAVLACFCYGFAAIPKFEKVSDHCYYFPSNTDSPNVAAVISDDGVLLVNPPSGPDATRVFEALKRLTARPVRWLVYTDYRLGGTTGADRFIDPGSLVLGSREMFRLAAAGKDTTPEGTASQEKKAPKTDETIAPARLEFDHQMRLFPGGVEVRVFALAQKAHTGADVVVYLPGEKVLLVGDLYVAGRFPDIDVTPGEGSVLGWLDGMRQVIDAVPLLKAAIPQKAETKPGEEKTLEESVTVISARGARSNLQEMKDLLESVQKIRAESARAFASGRDIESLLASPALSAYRGFENFEPFVRELFDALSKK